MEFKRNHIFFSGITISSAIAIIVFLAIAANTSSRYKKAFKRKFITENISISHQVKNIQKLRAVCGLAGNMLYFETDTPGYLWATDSTLSDGHFLNFTIGRNQIVQSLFTTIIDSPVISILAGNANKAIQIDLNDSTTRINYFLQQKFTLAAGINKNQFVLRGYKKIEGKWEQHFIKADFQKRILMDEKNISDKKGDAGFSTDGMLHYDELTNLLIYVNYFSNNVTCMDTSLQLVYKSHTIDTQITSQVKVGSVQSQKLITVTNNSPVEEVNLESCVSKGLLFINSAIIADNEIESNFTQNSIIDVYHVNNGRYIATFYIPLFKGKRMESFKVFDQRIVVLYPNQIVVYKTPLEVKAPA